MPCLRLALAGAALAASITGPLRAQDSDPRAAQPERPTVATLAGTVAPRYVGIETGVEYDLLEGGHQWLIPTVVKLGLASRLQFSLIGGALGPPGTSLGIGDLSFGLKWRLFDHAPVLGRFALEPILTVPAGNADQGRGTGTVAGSILLISSHSFGPSDSTSTWGTPAAAVTAARRRPRHGSGRWRDQCRSGGGSVGRPRSQEFRQAAKHREGRAWADRSRARHSPRRAGWCWTSGPTSPSGVLRSKPGTPG